MEEGNKLFRASFTNALPVTTAEIVSEIAKDPLLPKVYCYTMEGCPQQTVSEEMRPFYQRKEQLATDQGCLLWGTRVIVPAKLQLRLLKKLHFTHPGVVKMKLLACGYMWWHKIDQDIEEMDKWYIHVLVKIVLQNGIYPKSCTA